MSDMMHEVQQGPADLVDNKLGTRTKKGHRASSWPLKVVGKRLAPLVCSRAESPYLLSSKETTDPGPGDSLVDRHDVMTASARLAVL